jgi:mono/diheme cytochrome c family protein
VQRMRPWTLLLVAALVLGKFGPPALAAEEEAERRALVRRGARLWSPYCGACHNARPASERSPAEWDTIMLHMRVRANLPAEDARALLEYLKAR